MKGIIIFKYKRVASFRARQKGLHISRQIGKQFYFLTLCPAHTKIRNRSFIFVISAASVITAGLSTTGSAPLMFFRFLDRPQISIIELTATLPQNMLEQ